MSAAYPYLVVAIVALTTILVRFLPFLIFRGRKTPASVSYLGAVLPAAIMGMLVVYCLRNTEILTGQHGIPELISSLIVIFLYKWRRNTLLGILSGTAAYKLLIRFL